MTTSRILFRFPQLGKGAALGAALLFLGLQAANANSVDDMKNMGGRHDGVMAPEFNFGKPGMAAKVDRTVKVTMRDITFEPASLQLKAGETIRFVVTNASEIDHDFTIGDTKAQTAHRKEMAEATEKGDEMEHGDDPNAISVKAGEMGELIWKFTRVGTLEFDCNVPGHHEAGMKGVIAVLAKGGSDRSAGASAMPDAVTVHKATTSMTEIP